MKTTMSGMGNKMMGNSRLDIAEENIRDLEYLVSKMTKNEKDRNKILSSGK